MRVCARASTEAEAERDSCCSLSTKLLLFFLFFVFFFEMFRTCANRFHFQFLNSCSMLSKTKFCKVAI